MEAEEPAAEEDRPLVGGDGADAGGASAAAAAGAAEGAEGEEFVDLLLDFPELDGLDLRPGLPLSIRDLHGSVPEARVGDVVFRGQHELAIGTVLAAGPPSLCAALPPLPGGAGCGLVTLASLTSKKVVFRRHTGDLATILVDGGTGVTPMPWSAAAPSPPAAAAAAAAAAAPGGGRDEEEEEEEEEE